MGKVKSRWIFECLTGSDEEACAECEMGRGPSSTGFRFEIGPRYRVRRFHFLGFGWTGLGWTGPVEFTTAKKNPPED